MGLFHSHIQAQFGQSLPPMHKILKFKCMDKPDIFQLLGVITVEECR
jgi:hypothetical protein